MIVMLFCFKNCVQKMEIKAYC